MKTRKFYGLFLSAAVAMVLCGGAQQAWAGPAATATTLAVTSGGSAVTTVAWGSVVTLTATVTAGSTPVTPGQVKFCDATAAHCEDIHILGWAQLTSAGTATIKFRPAVGSHSYNAVFLRTTANASSSSAASALTVTGPYPSTTTIAESGNVGNYTLTATATGAGAATPTGTVSFLDTSNGNAVLGTATLGAAGLRFINSLAPSTGRLSFPVGIAVGDFNGDGIPDLAVAGLESGAVTILLGNGDGTFTVVAASPAVGGFPYSIAVGDFNGDGIPDLAVAVEGDPGSVAILLGNGDGTFTAMTPISSAGPDPWSIAVGDFNGDGNLDLVVGNNGQSSLTVLLGNGDGTFKVVAANPPTGQEPRSIVVGDFNGDGIPDLAVGSDSGGLTVLLGNGDGTFTTAASPFGTTNYIAAGDFNGDGILDLAVDGPGDYIVILLGNGDGTFTPAARPATGSGEFSGPSSIGVGDFNGDGIPDLAVSTPNGVVILLGNGDGTFMPPAGPTTEGGGAYSLVAGDFNGDGIPDLATANGLLEVILVEQAATASATGIALSGNSTVAHLVDASYPGDSNYSSSVSGTTSLYDTQVPTTLTLTTNLTGPVGTGQQFTLTATLSPSTWQGESSNGETITFYNGSSVMGTGTLSGGVATLAASLAQIGTDTFTASYGGDAYLIASSSNPVSVRVIASTTLTLSLSATSVVAGQPLTITATLSPYTSQGSSSSGEAITFYGGKNENGGYNARLGTSVLSGGVATFTVATLPLSGYDLVYATYSGDANLAASTSGLYSLAVTAAQPTLALSVSPADSASGQAVTLTATLSGFDAQSTNGESISFFSNGASIGTGTIASGVATLAISSLTLGFDSLTASYPGDADNTAANSNAVLEYVGKAGIAAPSVTLAVTSGGTAASSVAAGTAVTLTATVSSSGAPVAPGTVTFCDTAWSARCIGAGNLGTAQLNSSGTAAIAVRLGIGTHTLQALFNGTASVGGGISNASALTVTGMRRTVTVQSVTYNADVQAEVVGWPAFGPPFPSGTVRIIDTSEANAVLATLPITTWGESGYGLFGPAPGAAPATGTKPFSVAEGDFNHDGIPDLVVANSGSNTVSVLLGNGDGTYQAQVTYATGNGPYSVAVGDFNGDGNLDLAVANLTDNTVSILLGNGDGAFQAQKTYGTGGGPNAVVVGDFNGDGILDLAVANQSDATVSILLGNGDGTFKTEQAYAAGNGPVSIAVGDLNGDGIPDLAVANNLDGTVSILLGKGDGSFPTEVPYATGSKPISVAAGNLNGDNAPDLAVANLADNTVSVLMGNGDGTFQSQVTFPTDSNPYAVVANNFAGTGPLDLAVANSGAGSVTILVNNGSGVFNGVNEEYPTGAGPIALAAADLNGDGLPDLAVVDNSANTVSALLNSSSAYAEPDTVSFNLPGTHVLEAVYSGDASFSGSTSAGYSLVNPKLATSLTFTSNVNPSNYGNSVTLTAALAPYASQDGSTNGETVTFTSNGATLGTGTLSGGVATLTTTALPVGTNPIQASYPGDNEFNASTSVAFSLTVRPATLTVIAANASRGYGAANPPLTGTVSGAVNGDTFAVTGTTTATVTSPPGGYPVTPSASGAHIADYTVKTVNGTLTVVRATPTNTLASSANPAFVSNPVTFTASVSSSGGSAPTGSVTFYDGTTALGSVPLTSGTATYATSMLAAGSHSITAAYAGDSNYVNVTSSPLTEMIEDFTLAPASGSSSATVSPGGQATYTLAIDPPSGTTFGAAISLSVSGLPAGATGEFSPATVAAGSGPTNVTLTVSVPSDSSSARPAERPFGGGFLPLALGLMVFPFAGRLRRAGRRWKRMACWMALGLAAAMAAELTGCGGSSGGGSSQPPPPQSYTLTITATSGSLSHSTTVSLTVE